MRRYEDVIMEMLPGDSPRDKYNELIKIYKTMRQIAYPRRGSEEEFWGIETIGKVLAQHVKEIKEEE